jgi:hypothetical protein
MRFGVSTVRPSEDAAALAHRMGHCGVARVVVTRSGGTLIGLFFAAGVNLCCLPVPVPSAAHRPHRPRASPGPPGRLALGCCGAGPARR